MAGEGVVRNIMVVFGVKVKDLFQAERLQDGINSIEQGLNDLNRMAIKASVAMVGLGAGLIAATKPVAEAANETAKFANAFGISVQKMQEMSFGMESLGAEADDLADVMLQLSEKVGQVNEGSKEAVKNFLALGLSQEQLASMSPVEIFEATMQGLRGVTDQTLKFQVASQLLGEDLGKKLLPLITKGGSTLEDYAQIARDAGAIMDESQVKTGQRVHMTYKRLGAVVKALRTRIGLELMPYVDRIGQLTWDWYQANKELINSKIAEYAEEIGKSMEWVKETAGQIERLIERSGGLEKNFKRLAALAAAGIGLKVVIALITLASGVITVLGAVTAKVAIVFAIVAAQVAIFGATFAALAEDFMVLERGGQSFIGFLRDNFSELPLGFQALSVAIDALIAGFKAFGSWIGWVVEAFGWLWVLVKPFVPYLIAGLLAIGGVIFVALLSPILAVTSAIALLLHAMKLFWNVGVDTWRAIREEFGVFWAEIKGVPDALAEEFSRFVETVATIPSQIVKAFSGGVFSGVGTALSEEFSAFIAATDALPGEIIKAFAGIGDAIAEEFGFDKLSGMMAKLNPMRAIEGMFNTPAGMAAAQYGVTGEMNSMGNAGVQSAAAQSAASNMTTNRSVVVNAGDTTIRVDGAADPLATAKAVKAQQAMSWDSILNSAQNSSGGL